MHTNFGTMHSNIVKQFSPECLEVNSGITFTILALFAVFY